MSSFTATPLFSLWRLFQSAWSVGNRALAALDANFPLRLSYLNLYTVSPAHSMCFCFSSHGQTFCCHAIGWGRSLTLAYDLLLITIIFLIRPSTIQFMWTCPISQPQYHLPKNIPKVSNKHSRAWPTRRGKINSFNFWDSCQNSELCT